MAHDQTNYVPI